MKIQPTNTSDSTTAAIPTPQPHSMPIASARSQSTNEPTPRVKMTPGRTERRDAKKR